VLDFKRVLGVALPAALLLLALFASVSHAQIQPPTVFEIEGVRVLNVSDTGMASVREEIKFSAQAFTLFRQIYNPLSTFVRELEPRTIPEQIENLDIKLDEANNKLTATYTLLGAAVYKGNGVWELRIAEQSEKLTLSAQHGNTLVFTHVYGAGWDYRIVETLTVNLPAKAQSIKYDEDEKKITYVLNVSTGTSSGSARYAGVALIAIGGVMLAVPNVAKKRERGKSGVELKPQAPPPPAPAGSERLG